VGSRVYVRNLTIGTTEESVRTAFARAGRVSEVRVIANRETGRPRGFAFVTMGSAEEATHAIQAMNGTVLAGRPLRVSLAIDRGAAARRRGG
jgi:RNA recognition motif-containing protein